MVYPPGPDTIQMQYESKKFADCLLNNQHTITVPITIKVPALNATMSRKYCMACAVVYTCIYTATQSLLITLLSSARNIGVFSLASKEENRIYIMAEFGLRQGTTLSNTHVPLLLLPSFSDSPLSSSSVWSGYCCEETSLSTCWKIGQIKYKKYLDLLAHPPLTQQQPNRVYIYTPYRL